MPTLKIGSRVGDYQLERVLGSGNSSIVYLARPLNYLKTRPVALKVRLRGVGKHEQLLASRFTESARLQSFFCHPHIAWLYETIEDDKLQATAIEYLAGGTLTELLKRSGGRLPRDQACLLGAQLADGLDHMHDIYVIHRDLKPDNILFADPHDLSSVRIADFDVSKNPYTSPDLTEKGAHVGTLCYISPEQFNQEKPRATSDVYSLGVVLYEVLSGQLPFESVSAAAVFNRFLDHTPIPPLSEMIPETHGALDWILERALEIDPQKRIPSAATLAVLLLATSSQAYSHFSRLKTMKLQTRLDWLRPALKEAPRLVQRELIDSLREMGLNI